MQALPVEETRGHHSLNSSLLDMPARAAQAAVALDGSGLHA